MAAREKPNITPAQVSELLSRLYGLTSSEMHPLPSYCDQNFYVSVKEGGEYLFKVLNSGDSKNPTLVELQAHAMNFLYKRGLPVQTVVPTKTGQLMSLEEMDCGFGLQKYMVRLLTYLPGTTIAKIPISPTLLYQVGEMAATLDKVLQEMEHPNLDAFERESFIWNLSGVPQLEQYLHVLDGNPMQEVVSKVITQYKAQVVPKMNSFRKGVIHKDFNDYNIVVVPDGPAQYKISGILDFGDMSRGNYIFELAIAIVYMMIESPSPVDVGGHVLAGYESVIPLNEAERDCLFLLVLCRLCQSLVMAHYYVPQQPENEEYLMISCRKGVRHLSRLWELGKQQVENTWFECAKTYKQH